MLRGGYNGAAAALASAASIQVGVWGHTCWAAGGQHSWMGSASAAPSASCGQSPWRCRGCAMSCQKPCTPHCLLLHPPSRWWSCTSLRARREWWTRCEHTTAVRTSAVPVPWMLAAQRRLLVLACMLAFRAEDACCSLAVDWRILTQPQHWCPAGPALAWCAEQRPRLRKAKSKLEFKLRVQVGAEDGLWVTTGRRPGRASILPTAMP